MGMDPKQMRVLKNGQASEADLPRDTSREAVRDQEEGRRTMKARREHSKGDGNFPAPEAAAALEDERPEDFEPRDMPKAADDRSAPKGATTKGQRERNPGLEVRDDAKPARPRAQSGMTRARRATTPKRPTKRARPTARRSSAAKRDAQKRVVKRSAPKIAKTRGGASSRAKSRGATTSRAKSGGAARSRASRRRR